MAKKVTAITNRDDDFAQWYTDIVKKADLVDYSSVKGFMVYKPLGYGIWEQIQAATDKKFKDTNHENVYLPLVMPISHLEKEAKHVEGFAPEVLTITHAGKEKLEEPLCIRPTSEVLFCELYKDIVQSYNDLPKIYNQWCSVVRWEKSTRPFLRTSEFLWQEGHTLHETAEEGLAHTLMILDIYIDVFENYLAIPVVSGKKTDKEKFAGAESTYTIEAMMYDGRALQSGTSHYFGDGFARAFDITFTNRENKLETPFQTSYGVSTRSIGAIIMVHGDDNGLVIPPRVAPTQVIVIPVRTNVEGVTEKAKEVAERIKKVASVKIDLTDKSPGWKFAEHEMKGIPLRVEIGPKDIENNECVIARRDTSEKITVSLDELETAIPKILDDMHNDMFNKALKYQQDNTHTATNIEEMEAHLNKKLGFVKGMWCGDEACENELKEKLGVSSRCIIDEEPISDVCVCCGKKADKLVVWAKAY